MSRLEKTVMQSIDLSAGTMLLKRHGDTPRQVKFIIELVYFIDILLKTKLISCCGGTIALMFGKDK